MCWSQISSQLSTLVRRSWRAAHSESSYGLHSTLETSSMLYVHWEQGGVRAWCKSLWPHRVVLTQTTVSCISVLWDCVVPCVAGRCRCSIFLVLSRNERWHKTLCYWPALTSDIYSFSWELHLRNYGIWIYSTCQNLASCPWMPPSSSRSTQVTHEFHELPTSYSNIELGGNSGPVWPPHKAFYPLSIHTIPRDSITSRQPAFFFRTRKTFSLQVIFINPFLSGLQALLVSQG